MKIRLGLDTNKLDLMEIRSRLVTNELDRELDTNKLDQMEIRSGLDTKSIFFVTVSKIRLNRDENRVRHG